MLVAEKFIRSLVSKYGRHAVYTDGGPWYDEACNILKLKHYLHSSFEKSLIDGKGQSNEQQGKQNRTTKTTEEYRESIKKSLDDTRDNIRRSIDESRHNIPRYTTVVNEYQEQTLQAARDIAESYVDTQKEIINTLEYTWIPFSPGNITEVYATMVSGFADNIITGARLANNMLFSNMDAYKKIMQQTKENSQEISRLSVNTARNIQKVTRKYVEPR